MAVPCRDILGSRTEETGVNPAGLRDGDDRGPSVRAVQRKPLFNLTSQGYWRDL